MYLRSPRFAECVGVMLDAGAAFEDPLLEAILLDDEAGLRQLIALDRGAPAQRMNLECAFTSLRGVTPLHVCAEYNSVRCARALLDQGVNVNARADVDKEGLGGHTALFHTVNSHRNYSRPAMELLVNAGADLKIQLKGVRWGEGFEWETSIFDVTPISYAQCGLFTQFQRNEEDIYSNIEYLQARRSGGAPARRNVPNRYLLPDRAG